MASASAPKIGLLVLVALLPVMIPRTSGQLSVPSRPLGYVYTPHNTTVDTPIPPVTFTLFIDNTCPDSKQAFPILVKVADHFGPNQMRLVTHLFSLPYHRNSHVIAKGAHAIQAYRRSLGDFTTKAVYAWIQIAFDHQDQLTTAATAELNDDQVLMILAPLASIVSGIPKDKFMTDVFNTTYDTSARLDFKYSCTRGAYQVPFFMLNDVTVEAPYQQSFDQWVKQINQLLDNDGH